MRSLSLINYKSLITIGLHPGTVDTKLSRPYTKKFSNNVFTPKQAAQNIIRVLDNVSIEANGKILDYNGKVISY